MNKIYLSLLLSCLYFTAFSQLSINITDTTSATCPSNGTVTWEITGNDSGATLSYEIYQIGSTTPIVELSANNYTGLVPGDFKIVAKHTLNETTTTAEKAFTIANEIIPFEFKLEGKRNEMCIGDALIYVSVSSGVGPFEYQLFTKDSNGEETIVQVLENQSNYGIIENIKAGQYFVRVKDNCGTALVKEVEFENVAPIEVDISYLTAFNCNGELEFRVKTHPDRISRSRKFKVEIEYANPNDPSEIINDTLEKTVNGTGPGYLFMRGKFPLTLFKGEIVDYKWQVTDECGSVETGVFSVKNFDLNMKISNYENLFDSCGDSFGFKLNLIPEEGYDRKDFDSVIFNQVPTGVDPTAIKISNDNGDVIVGDESYRLEPGKYTGIVKICDQEIDFSFDYLLSEGDKKELTAFSNRTLDVAMCSKLSFFKALKISNPIKDYKMIDAPVDSHYIFRNIRYNSFFQMYTADLYLFGYPSGSVAKFEVTDICDQKLIIEIKVYYSTKRNAEIDFVETCGGFNMDLVQSASYGFKQYLQIFDEDLGGWVSPENNKAKVVFDENNTTYSGLLASSMRLYFGNSATMNLEAANIQFKGKYRLLDVYEVPYYDANSPNDLKNIYCHTVIKEYENTSGMQFEDFFAFKCGNGTYSVVTNANGGVGELNFQIVSDPSKNTADNILKDNSQSNVFTDVTSGVKYFRAVDECGNYVTKELEIALLTAPEITMNYNCVSPTEADEVELIVNGVDYLNFEWYKNDDTTNVLSTDNALRLGTFDESMKGTYQLKLTSNVTTSCVSTVLEHKVFNLNNACRFLPVELANFSAKKVNDSVELDWTTFSENNNSHFNILRSINGVDFEKIAEVKGNGTTAFTSDYSFVDVDAAYLGAKLYYKLQQIDFDGSIDDSFKVVEVDFDNEERLTISPNPANDFVNVKFTEKIQQVTIINSSGGVVLEIINPETNTLDISQLSKGFYLMKVKGETVEQTVKLIK